MSQGRDQELQQAKADVEECYRCRARRAGLEETLPVGRPMKDGEVETSVYGEVAKVKQDRMIPVFRCMVIETLVAQYCGMFSAAGVKRYIRFRELRPLKAWECRQARLNG
jgi:hypothetical protein